MSNIPGAIMYLLQSQPNQAARERLIAQLLSALPNNRRLMLIMNLHTALTNMPNTPAVRAQRNQLGRIFWATMPTTRRTNGGNARRNGGNGAGGSNGRRNGGNSAGINALLAAAANMNNGGNRRIGMNALLAATANNMNNGVVGARAARPRRLPARFTS
jgi:hypothetical protein